MVNNQTNITFNSRSNTVKKVLFVAFMVMAFVALGSMAAFACGEHKATKTADASKVDAKQVSSTSCGTKASTTNATMASTKTTTANGAACTVADKAACAAKLAAGQCTIEECLKACQAKFTESMGADAANYHLVAMSIKGMTCGGCETSVKTALMAVEGVNSVIDVCHKAGFAVVSVKNDSKFENLSVVKAVSAKGFESEIIPAVAVTVNEPANTEKAECSAHKKDGSK
jgi:copper chaperone CopZ